MSKKYDIQEVFNLLGEDVLNRFAEGLSDVAEVESKPKFEFKSIYMVLAPKK